jgi:hypothetical protein
MRITVRGWGRDQGEREIMSAGLADAESPAGSYSRGKVYKAVLNQEDRRKTKVRVSTSTELRLGGTYLLHVELSRREIAQLFYETHSGSMVRMVRSFIEEEASEDRALLLQQMARLDERRRQRLAQEEQAEPHGS